MWRKMKLAITYYFFVGFWSLLTVFNLLVTWIVLRQPIFSRKLHKRPVVLNDHWNHGFLELANVRLHYVETGSTEKPLMLLLHGFPEFWYTWRFQLRYFSSNYRVVAIDQRGYGESDSPLDMDAYNIDEIVDDAKQVIAKLGYNEAVVIGHDWGGAIAWRLAAYYPKMVSKLIILNCPHPLAMGELFSKTWSQFLRSWYMLVFQTYWLPEFLVTANDLGFFEKIFRGENYGLALNAENFDEDDIEAWKYTFSQQGAVSGPINWYRAAMRGSSRLSKDQLIQPKTLIIWGNKDAFLVKEGAEISKRYCEKVRLEFIDGASHWVQQDAPDQVNQLIEQFLKD